MKTLRADQVKSWVHWLERHEKPLVKLAIVTGFADSLVIETTYYLNGVTCISLGTRSPCADKNAHLWTRNSVLHPIIFATLPL